MNVSREDGATEELPVVRIENYERRLLSVAVRHAPTAKDVTEIHLARFHETPVEIELMPKMVKAADWIPHAIGDMN